MPGLISDIMIMVIDGLRRCVHTTISQGFNTQYLFNSKIEINRG